jgi:hypothetical protein
VELPPEWVLSDSCRSNDSFFYILRHLLSNVTCVIMVYFVSARATFSVLSSEIKFTTCIAVITVLINTAPL